MAGRLEKDYGGKWVAIKGTKQVINSASSVETLIKKISKENLGKVTFAKIPKSNCTCLL